MRPFMKKVMNSMKKQEWDDGNIITGTIPYNDYPTFNEWDKQFEGYCGMGSVTTDRYYSKLPVWAGGNLYFNGAKPMKKELDAFVNKKDCVTIGFTEKDGKIFLKTNVFDFIPDANCKLLKTDDIPMAFEPEEKYENPDGSQIIFDTDFFGEKRTGTVIAGPFADKNELEKPLFCTK